MRELGLHYRTSLLAGEDASASMAITYDVEVWLPSMGTYKEVSSASHAGDYQARRANVKYRMPDSKRSEFVHTLNGSALATSRLVPALLEQHVQPDGSVTVPEPLQDRSAPTGSSRPPAEAEGVGFEPTGDRTAPSGFQGRCIQPLCHPSEVDIVGRCRQYARALPRDTS